MGASSIVDDSDAFSCIHFAQRFHKLEDCGSTYIESTSGMSSVTCRSMPLLTKHAKIWSISFHGSDFDVYTVRVVLFVIVTSGDVPNRQQFDFEDVHILEKHMSRRTQSSRVLFFVLMSFATERVFTTPASSHIVASFAASGMFAFFFVISSFSSPSPFAPMYPKFRALVRFGMRRVTNLG